MHQLREHGYTLTIVRTVRVIFDKNQRIERSVTRRAGNRNAEGIVKGGILTRDEVAAELGKDTRTQQAVEAGKAARDVELQLDFGMHEGEQNVAAHWDGELAEPTSGEGEEVATREREGCEYRLVG